ncbi:MAG TPA: elongation factor 1-beta [Candidatus Lokiarchaeia archaeon]|nr:elongation factor 1-beta [Candidatus Lokiarchaeia archaeon]
MAKKTSTSSKKAPAKAPAKKTEEKKEEPKKVKEKIEGTNVAVISVLPEDETVDFSDLRQKLEEALHDIVDLEGNSKTCQLMAMSEEDIAFGLKKLKIQVSMPEFMAGGTQPVEDALTKIPGVQRVEVDVITRL